jgi:Domain of unknown function (DUF4326)
MTVPRRIRLSRRRGWRKPPNAVVVARPSKWGNPYVIDEQHSRADVVALFRRAIERNDSTVLPYTADDVRRHLAGRDLACWCPLDEPCHASVLLEIANAPTWPATCSASPAAPDGAA